MDAEKGSIVSAAVSTSDNETGGSQDKAGIKRKPQYSPMDQFLEENPQGTFTMVMLSRRWQYRLARLGFMLFLLGVTLLIVLSLLLVRPALSDMKLKSAECRVISSEMTNERIRCRCGAICKSSYPCLEIQVTFNADGEEHTAYLYKDVHDDKNKCSTQPCEPGTNYYEVLDFRDKYGKIDNSYNCFYRPKNLDEVFIKRNTLETNEMIITHCTFWPSLMSAIGIGMLITFFCRFKGYCCFKMKGGPCLKPQPTTGCIELTVISHKGSPDRVVTNFNFQQHSKLPGG